VPTSHRVNVVVGAASGIGAAVAGQLAGRGPLIVADQNIAGVRAIASELGDDAQAVVCDITSASDVAALVARVGRLGDLVVTAGLSPSMAAGQRILDVNLVGRTRIVDAFEATVGPGSVAVVFAAAGAHSVPEIPEVLACSTRRSIQRSSTRSRHRARP
jgi:NAD(P)-dependent dehydrogenase (short-subunit alcohol dehydrogenase family)